MPSFSKRILNVKKFEADIATHLNCFANSKAVSTATSDRENSVETTGFGPALPKEHVLAEDSGPCVRSCLQAALLIVTVSEARYRPFTMCWQPCISSGSCSGKCSRITIRACLAFADYASASETKVQGPTVSHPGDRPGALQS